MTEAVLDATDRALLALLRDDARAPTAELARKLKLSRTTVQSRMERLQRQRVIAGFTITVPDELEAGLVRAHVLITLAPKRSGAIELALRRIPEVRVLQLERSQVAALDPEFRSFLNINTPEEYFDLRNPAPKAPVASNSEDSRLRI